MLGTLYDIIAKVTAAKKIRKKVWLLQDDIFILSLVKVNRN
jgi:translation initiation factor IF-1